MSSRVTPSVLPFFIILFLDNSSFLFHILIRLLISTLHSSSSFLHPFTLSSSSSSSSSYKTENQMRFRCLLPSLSLPLPYPICINSFFHLHFISSLSLYSIPFFFFSVLIFSFFIPPLDSLHLFPSFSSFSLFSLHSSIHSLHSFACLKHLVDMSNHYQMIV